MHKKNKKQSEDEVIPGPTILSEFGKAIMIRWKLDLRF